MVGRIVLDNSVLVPLFFPDERAKFSDMVFAKVHDGTRLISPRLAVLEFGNTVLKGIRHKRLAEAAGEAALEDFAMLPIEFRDMYSELHLPRLLRLARKRGLSAYDATYLALAIDEGAVLATLDSALRQAAEAEGVALVA